MSNTTPARGGTRTGNIGPYLTALKQRGAERPHGTRLRYISGCKCVPCRAANSQYETGRLRARREGDWNGYVDATTSREWLIRLSAKGIGRRAVSDATGLSQSLLHGITRGDKTRIRARTERLITAVDQQARADGSLVAAGPTWKRIDELLDLGYTKVWIARQIGNGTEKALQLGRVNIEARSASAIERLCIRIEQGRVSRAAEACASARTPLRDAPRKPTAKQKAVG